MNWQALLMIYDNITETSKWIIQTEDQKLYPLTITGNNAKEEIAHRIAQIADIPQNRVSYKDQHRRRDNHTVYNYYVMTNDNTPPF